MSLIDRRDLRRKSGIYVLLVVIRSSCVWRISLYKTTHGPILKQLDCRKEQNVLVSVRKYKRIVSLIFVLVMKLRRGFNALSRTGLIPRQRLLSLRKTHVHVFGLGP